MSAALATKITVAVPTYRPGEGLQRVVDSLDAQTLPVGAFEVVFVDDGSPDDTYRRLQEIAATRSNYRVTQIEHSGWPSRPRNLAIQLARGEYVLFMDHDDALYPDALRRLVEYGEQTRADLISPKESKTSDVWWCMPELAEGNAADLKAEGQIRRLLPMVPHKAYRREFLLNGQITFPEGRRQLWEDIYFNIEAYAKASRVALLADTPVYLWHESSSNSSGTYSAADAEFWDHLDSLMAFVDTTLSAPELATERRTMLMHLYQGRVLRRSAQVLRRAGQAAAELTSARARSIQAEYIPPDWDAELGLFGQIRAELLRRGRADLLAAFGTATAAGLSSRTTVTRAEWRGGILEIDATARWYRSGPDALGLRRAGGRLLLDLPRSLSAELGDDLLDVTERIETFSLEFGARARAEHVTWQLPVSSTVEVVDQDGQETVLVARATARLDPATGAYHRALPDTVWDLVAETRWEGISLTSPVAADIRPLPALIDGRSAVAYANRAGGLSLDLAHRLRSAVLDADIRPGAVRRSAHGFAIPLRGVHTSGFTRRSLDVVLSESEAGTPTTVPAWLVGTIAGARLEIVGPIPAGRHRLRVSTGAATLSGKLSLRMGRSGLLWIDDPNRPRHSASRPRQALRRLARRISRRARRARASAD